MSHEVRTMWDALAVESTPVFDAVVAEQNWEPADLGPPFDVAAVVAASYAMMGKPVPQDD